MKKMALLLFLMPYKIYPADQELRRLGKIELDSPKNALLRQKLYQQEKTNISLRERVTSTEHINEKLRQENLELQEQNLVLKKVITRLSDRMSNTEEMNRIISEDLVAHHRRLSEILELVETHQKILERNDKDELETISEPEISD